MESRLGAALAHHHGRAWPGHPRLAFARAAKPWMPTSTLRH